MLQARLLGDFVLLCDDQTLQIPGPRVQSILAYLMHHAGLVQSRQHIAYLFWPDTSEGQARNNLRQLLHQLRQSWPYVNQYLAVDASTLLWRASPQFSLDVAEFEAALAQADAAHLENDAVKKRKALAYAVKIYQGDLLPSCYDEWVAPERERLRRVFADALLQWVQELESQREFAAAIGYARRLLELDPLYEDHALILMRLHALNDDRTGALQVYKTSAAALQDELGIEPGPALRQAYERLLAVDEPAEPVAPARRVLVDVSSPLIGRQPEWEQLRAIWQRATQEHTQCIFISGEAGIGKSRLAEELMLWASRQGIGVARTRAYAAEGRLSYAPVTDWLRSDAIRGALSQMDPMWRSEIARIVPELLTEDPHLPRPTTLNDETQRQRFFEALARAVLGAHPPLLLVIDDLQWCDQETLEWIRYVLRFDAPTKLLIVGTVRSEEVEAKHPLTRLMLDLRHTAQFGEIELKRLDAAESERLASYILNRQMNLNEAMNLYRDTEGNPLFVVEMARAGLGKGIEGQNESKLKLPARVQAVILSRLAQLSEQAIEVMSLGATVGRAFGLDVLVQASDANEESVLQSLDELWQRRIVHTQDANRYDFTHDKLRDVAYAQLGPAKQRLLHRRVARAIEAVYAADLDPVSAALAAHFEQAGHVEQAILFNLRAAQVAQRIFAYADTVKHIKRGLHLLGLQKGNPLPAEIELEFLSIASVLPVGSLGLQVSEQLEMLTRARDLNHRLGKPIDPSVLRMLAVNHILTLNFRKSITIGEQLLALGESRQAGLLIVEGNYVLGSAHHHLGLFSTARRHWDQAIHTYDPQYLQIHLASFGWDPKAISLCRQAINLWCLGDLDQAEAAQQSARAYAEAIAHPFSMAYVMFFGALLHFLSRDVTRVRQEVEHVIKLSLGQGIGFWLYQGMVLEGWAMAAMGEHELGWARMEAGMTGRKALGIRNFNGIWTGLFAEHDAAMGQTSQAMSQLSQALDDLADAKEGEHWYEAELYRVMGDIQLTQDATAAEAAYGRAISIARDQSARSFELRTTIRLARLWQTQGKFVDARNVLQPVYHVFTEGLDTHDLKEARALLDQLTFY